MPLEDRILDEAAAWAARTGDPSFADWEGFTAWLERDPAHARAYDFVMAGADDAAAALAEEPRAANDDTPARSGTGRRWAIGALTAALVGMAAFGALQLRGGTYSVETAAGETRVIALGGGSSVTLGGGSTITLDHDDPRFARLDKGQALFSVRHDAANPFHVDAGEDRLVDIGTVFDVRFDGMLTTVAVAEGAVSFNPAQQNVRIDPGKFVSSAEGSREYELGNIAASEVGAWRTGRLSFQQATLGAVADDLTRATGTSFSTSTGAARRRVSGSLLVDPVKADPGSVGPLLGVRVRKSADGWMLEPQ
ncbi:MAG: FecR domain-containing protein [Candidatus Andeanibacterium colombiense]|uniref:FecR domain-containing protein n=1 Tax=Candidatus Andeanibacterium colombiense TaxID=3121345 RepID=A0AAJ5X900_9SPHN|nr:MAG: FecR domain-containing protein [Sphingomonadaceae bacterium]